MTDQPPFPSFTSKWHTGTYPALSPVGRAKAKTVVITGASGGIGRATAVSFAKAGAAKIALLGRREEALQETQKTIEAVDPQVQTSIHICDSTDTLGLQNVARSIGSWDVLILNAGIAPKAQKIQIADLSTWWTAFETNVQGTLITTQSFIPQANTTSTSSPPTIIALSAALIFTPTFPIWSGSSAYTASKLALAQMMQHLAEEHPEINVVNVHPGVVDTAMLPASEEEKKDMKTMGFLDEKELPADFFVWCTVPENGSVVRGRWVCANWDVEELVDKREVLETNGEMLTIKPMGWPFDTKQHP